MQQHFLKALDATIIARRYDHVKLFKRRMGCPAAMDESYPQTAIAKSFDAGTQF
jgi:hypothetical protein